MAKTPVTIEQKQKQKIRALEKQIAEHEAFRLNAYPDPIPLDIKKALAESTDKTRFGQPYVQAWVVGDEGPVQNTILLTTKVNLNLVFADKVCALIAYRNRLAQQTATQLLALDRKIDEETDAAHTQAMVDLQGDTEAAHQIAQENGAESETPA